MSEKYTANQLDILKEVLRYLCTEAAVEVPEVQFPIIIKKGINDFGKEITYYFNYSDDAQMIAYHGADCNMLMQKKSVKDGDMLTINGWDFIILESC